MMKSRLRDLKPASAGPPPRLPPLSAAEGAYAMPQRIDARAARAALPLWGEAALRAAEAHWAPLLPAHALMQRAGEAASRLLAARWPHARRVLLLCGPGNNGGDGLAAAASLARRDVAPRLRVVLVGCGDASQWNPQRRPADWCWALAQARAAGLQPVAWEGGDAAGWLRDADAVVDALLGLGLREAPRGQLGEAVQALDGRPEGLPLLALDLPSGLRGATGEAPGAHVRADATLAMLGLQPGHVGGPQAAACGELWLDALQVDMRAAAPAAPRALLGDSDSALRALPPLHRAAHKGERGDVRLFGGAAGMTGALWLAARAALLLGGGRVYAASLDPRAPAVDAEFPELMLRDVDSLLEAARGAGRGAACHVFGPGAGASPQALRCLLELLDAPQPLVIDADGLNLLAAQPRDGAAWQALRRRAHAAWLTPHPTEAARLLECETSSVQSDRLAAARRLCELTGAQVVLKGAGSVIACTDGTTWVNHGGNGLLATAGTGDVLAGALGACLARSAGASHAARAAVWLHAAAAELALRDGAALRAGTLAQWMLRAWREAAPGVCNA